VRRTRIFVAAHVLIGATTLVASSHAQRVNGPGTLAEVSLPGGIVPALAAIADPVAPDRAQFLSEFIRRTYDTPFASRIDSRDRVLQSLLAYLKAQEGSSGPSDTVPLPLTIPIWTDLIFGGRATPATLVRSILESRPAALLYYALLSLDDDTRTWLADQPELLKKLLVDDRSAALLASSTALRMTRDGLRLPGGAPAAAVWHALLGQDPNQPLPFIEALLTRGNGRLAHFLGALSQLTPEQIAFALTLRSGDEASRVDAARRLYAVFERTATGRTAEQRVFTRPLLDPVLLAAELAPAASGAPRLPGTRAFWSAVFSEEGRADDSAALVSAAPADFAWICEQVFRLDPEQRRRYAMVLFASRQVGEITAATVKDSIEAIRAVAMYPALAASLERAGVRDIAALAAAARRASALAAIGDHSRAYRALAQFQGALALVTRAATRGSIDAARVTEFVSALAAIPISDRGDYEGRVVCWLNGWLRAQAPSRPDVITAMNSAEDVFQAAGGPVEQAALRLLAGPPVRAPEMLEWEGTRYRVDLRRAEALRLAAALGDSPRGYLSAAEAVATAADSLAEKGLTQDRLQQIAQEIAGATAADVDDEPEGAVAVRLTHDRSVLKAVERAARDRNVSAASRQSPALRLFADELLARGLMEFAYAAALGQREGLTISAADAARRHEFGFKPPAPRVAPWRLPQPGGDAMQRWHVSGALLGLDVGLSDFSLVPLSLKPPPRPTLADADRRAFIDAVALVQPSALVNADRDAITAAIHTGRDALTTARTASDAEAIADRASLSALRRSLLRWVVEHDRARLPAFLSPSELLWVGWQQRMPETLNVWGASAMPSAGCLCLRMLNRQPWEIYSGRLNSGMLASAFPELNLRLAELLAELHMPAVLLAPVLTSATLDFVNSAVSRGPDDRRGLVEYVQALRPERVEQYLALLTTDGPLVPVGHAAVVQDVANQSSYPVPGVHR
jgi:hypothetical protein